MFRKNRTLSFVEKKNSVRGIFSAVLGGSALIVAVVAVVLACRHGGNAGRYIGGAGIMAWLCTLMGVLFGIGGMLERDKYRLWAGIGLLLNAVLLICLTYLFVRGL